MNPERLILEWIDIAQGFLRSSNWIAAGMSSGPLNAELQAASNAELLYATQALPARGTATPVGGQYSLTQDVALLNFQTLPGVSTQLVIPGPQNAVFGPNSTVVDPTSPLVTAIIAAALGVLTDQFGNVATAYISGSKSSRRTEQL